MIPVQFLVFSRLPRTFTASWKDWELMLSPSPLARLTDPVRQSLPLVCCLPFPPPPARRCRWPSLGVRVHEGSFSPDQRMSGSQVSSFLSCSLLNSQINSFFFAATSTLTLISSQLLERDAFLLRPPPWSRLGFLRKRRRGLQLLVIVLVSGVIMLWSQGSHWTKTSLETEQLICSRGEIHLKVREDKGRGWEEGTVFECLPCAKCQERQLVHTIKIVFFTPSVHRLSLTPQTSGHPDPPLFTPTAPTTPSIPHNHLPSHYPCTHINSKGKMFSQILTSFLMQSGEWVDRIREVRGEGKQEDLSQKV